MPKITKKIDPKDTTSTNPSVEIKIEDAKVKKEGTVTVEYSLTKNLGDYNSLKITAGLTLPVGYAKSDLVEANESIKIACDVVQEFVELKVAEVSA